MGGSIQADDQLLHDITQRHHGHEPPNESLRLIFLNFTGVTKSDHHGSSGARQTHDTQQLNEEERNRQEPINVTVGVVERRTGEADLVIAKMRDRIAHIEHIKKSSNV